jgi:hypothetical protein
MKFNVCAGSTTVIGVWLSVAMCDLKYRLRIELVDDIYKLEFSLIPVQLINRTLSECSEIVRFLMGITFHL